MNFCERDFFVQKQTRDVVHFKNVQKVNLSVISIDYQGIVLCLFVQPRNKK